MATGTATIDFGASPGKSEATIAVTAQAGIVAGSLVECWVNTTGTGTADHGADEHLAEDFDCKPSAIVAGTGFTINVFCRRGQAIGQWIINWVWV